MKTTGVSCVTKFRLLVFLGHPNTHECWSRGKNWIGDGSCLWGCVWRGVGSGGSEKLFSGEIRFKFDPLFVHILHQFIDTKNIA